MEYLYNWVRLHYDAAVTKIVSPVGIIDTFSTKPVQATVANYASIPDNFEAYFTIAYAADHNLVYSDSYAVANLGPKQKETVTFKPWSGPRDTGLYTARCSVYTEEDTYRANDTMSSPVIVVNDNQTIWMNDLPFMPPGHKNKPVNDGGALAFNLEGDSGYGYVYGFKGNNTTEFYQYNPGTNVWTTEESIPWIGSSEKKKGVKAGAAMASLHGKIYAVKGNGANDFFRYNPTVPSGSRWSRMPSVPGVAIKNGCGIVSIPPSGVGADTLGYLYLLKGSSSYEFWRYNFSDSAWEQMPNAPSGPSGKSFAVGSCLANDSASIYALKGGYNEFFQYTIATDSWTTLAPLPLIGLSGLKKKSGAGAALACLSYAVYALKGNNTSEFWGYVYDKWTPLLGMPAGTGKNVKGGGALVADDFLFLYALKGNSTLEYYICEPSPLYTALPAAPQSPAMRSFTVAPNPFRGHTIISFSLARSSEVSLKLYDLTGKLVTVLASGRRAPGVYTQVLERSSGLASGIYLLRFDGDGQTTTRKLILE
jgi:hypothetical protein